MSFVRYTWTFIGSALIETRAFDDTNRVNLPGAKYSIGDQVIYREDGISKRFLISGVRQNSPTAYEYSVRTLRGDLFPFCFFEPDLSAG